MLANSAVTTHESKASRHLYEALTDEPNVVNGLCIQGRLHVNKMICAYLSCFWQTFAYCIEATEQKAGRGENITSWVVATTSV